MARVAATASSGETRIGSLLCTRANDVRNQRDVAASRCGRRHVRYAYLAAEMSRGVGPTGRSASALFGVQVGTYGIEAPFPCRNPVSEESPMDSIIYLVGLVVVVMAILSFIGLR